MRYLYYALFVGKTQLRHTFATKLHVTQRFYFSWRTANIHGHGIFPMRVKNSSALCLEKEDYQQEAMLCKPFRRYAQLLLLCQEMPWRYVNSPRRHLTSFRFATKELISKRMPNQMSMIRSHCCKCQRYRQLLTAVHLWDVISRCVGQVNSYDLRAGLLSNKFNSLFQLVCTSLRERLV